MKSVLNSFSKNLVFAIAKCPFIVKEIFQAFIFLDFVSLDIWEKNFSAQIFVYLNILEGSNCGLQSEKNIKISSRKDEV